MEFSEETFSPQVKKENLEPGVQWKSLRMYESGRGSGQNDLDEGAVEIWSLPAFVNTLR